MKMTTNKINPIWIKPEKWEDYLNGMYETKNRPHVIKQCYQLLKRDCYSEMKRVLKEWKNCTSVNLSKKVWNNNAWLGQATCSLMFDATIQETTTAWANLTIEEQNNANDIANKVIEEWKDEVISRNQCT